MAEPPLTLLRGGRAPGLRIGDGQEVKTGPTGREERAEKCQGHSPGTLQPLEGWKESAANADVI